ncbi:MAG: hypothetical protein A2099_05075 [Planctomycetes bacterium GWF2_39_10]|nr:MAG: hypothetical protein A2Y09_06095 [Planctomycetes bacterium GWA2_39_15]OHB52265.1 MAG: hypothetical protein A2099_05075 [Planctomycetes bacterium GWF2_39_10]
MAEIVADNISIIQSDDLEGATRLDAEYYQPKYLETITLIGDADSLRTYLEEIIHPTEIKRLYSEKGIQILLAQNIRNNRLDFSTSVYMEESKNKALKRNNLKYGDVCMTRSGANFGDTATYLGVPANIFACADCLILRPRRIEGSYIATFLNTKHGKYLLERGAYGMAQPHIAPNYLYDIRLPYFSLKFETEIKNIIEKSYELFEKSNILYSKAETLLLEELGIKDIDLSHDPCYEVNSADTIAANRIDAEYYQPKYNNLLLIIKKKAKYYRQVKEFRSFNARGEQPIYVKEGNLRVINSRHILEQHLDYENSERTHEQNWNLQSNARVFKYDILTYTTGAYVGRTNIYLENDRTLGSNHVNILRFREENPIYVSVVLNSMIGRLQTKRLVTGSAQVELYPCDIDKFIIPFIDTKKQEHISSLVEESYRAKREAKALLGEAKKKVEEMIEKGKED